MTAATPAAGAALGEEAGRQHEQAGVRIEIARGTRIEGGAMGGENLGPARMSLAEPRRMRFGERPRLVPLLQARTLELSSVRLRVAGGVVGWLTGSVK